MRILVCIKQVPRTGAALDPVSGGMVRSLGERMLNPHDEAALELAFRLRDACPGARVEVLTMGPEFASEMLRDALAAGADCAYLLSGAAFAGADVLATSRALAAAVRFLGLPEILVCGEHTTDGGTGHTGAALAARLRLCCADGVMDLVSAGGDHLRLRRSPAGEDLSYLTEVPLPCLLTAKSGQLPLRLPSLRSKLAARNKEIIRIEPESLGAAELEFLGSSGSRTRVEKITVTEKPPKLELEHITGEDAAKLLYKVIRERTSHE